MKISEDRIQEDRVLSNKKMVLFQHMILYFSRMMLLFPSMILNLQLRSFTFSQDRILSVMNHDLWSYTLARSCNLTEDLLISQEKLQDCKEELHTENNEKQVLQRKLNLVCGLGPSWSGWSSCSKTCWGIKTRIDRCSNSDEQIKSCNQYSSCPRSGK